VLCVDALKAAVAESKKGKNPEYYRMNQKILQAVAPEEPEARSDEDWVDATVRRNKVETTKLEEQLKQYKNNLVKESIRVCQI
jgi:COP9 signalosome complex subunit 1